jgi:hypothetical protein
MMRKPPGYSEAPISEVYVYNGKDWVLSSDSSPRYYIPSDSNWVEDSDGVVVGGDPINGNPPDHALSRRPDRTYQPAPSGSHYRYDKTNHSWTLEGDGGSPIPMTDPTDKQYYIYDSNGVQVLAVGIPNSSDQPTTATQPPPSPSTSSTDPMASLSRTFESEQPTTNTAPSQIAPPTLYAGYGADPQPSNLEIVGYISTSGQPIYRDKTTGLCWLAMGGNNYDCVGTWNPSTSGLDPIPSASLVSTTHSDSPVRSG